MWSSVKMKLVLRELHRNLLLPIGHLPLEPTIEPTPVTDGHSRDESQQPVDSSQEKPEDKAHSANDTTQQKSVKPTDSTEEQVGDMDVPEEHNSDSDGDMVIQDITVQPQATPGDDGQRREEPEESGSESGSSEQSGSESGTSEESRSESGEDEENDEAPRTEQAPVVRRSTRTRKKPAWMSSGEYVTQAHVMPKPQQEWMLKAQFIQQLASDGTLTNLPKNACDMMLKIIAGK